MSRSYKKTPVCKDDNRSKKFGKKMANKKTRKTANLSGKSKHYRKAYETWDVCDFRTYKECDMDFDEEELNHWKKWYLRK